MRTNQPVNDHKDLLGVVDGVPGLPGHLAVWATFWGLACGYVALRRPIVS
jgi:hypothetical protein